MRRVIFLSLFFLFLPLFSWAFSLTITATGDNYLYYYNWAKETWQKLDAKTYNSWKTPATLTLEWDADHPFLLLAVKNRGSGSPGNPAGLLAQVEIPDQVIVSNSSWEVLAVPSAWSGTELSDPQEYLGQTGWQPAQWYAANSGEINPARPEADGTNNNGKSLWYEENDRSPIQNIIEEAEWIWTNNNFSPDMDKGAIFRIRIPSQGNSSSSSVVPEPSNLSLLFLGLLPVSLVIRQKVA